MRICTAGGIGSFWLRVEAGARVDDGARADFTSSFCFLSSFFPLFDVALPFVMMGAGRGEDFFELGLFFFFYARTHQPSSIRLEASRSSRMQEEAKNGIAVSE